MHDRALREWLAASELPAKPIPVNLPTSPALVYNGRCILRGWSLTMTGGPGSLAFFDGQDAKGTMAANPSGIAGSYLAAGPASKGIMCEIGVFLVMTTFTAAVGTIWLTPVSKAGYERPFGPGNEPPR